MDDDEGRKGHEERGWTFGTDEKSLDKTLRCWMDGRTERGQDKTTLGMTLTLTMTLTLQCRSNDGIERHFG